MNDSQTLYDQVVRKVKNNKVGMLVLLVFGGLLAVAQLQGALSGIINALLPPKTRIEVIATIQSYDFMVGKTESAKPLAPVAGDIARREEIANRVASEVVSAIGAGAKDLDVSVQIEGRSLRASQPLRVSIIVFGPQMSQVARISKDLGDAENVDLQSVFGDPQFLDPRGSSVDMEVRPRTGYFEREAFRVFKHGQAFSFEPDQNEATTTIRFMPHKPRIILEDFRVGTDHAEDLRSFEPALRTQLQVNSSLELSTLSVQELEAKRADIQRLGPGGAKQQFADQYSVDYIVGGTVVLK
jgi:hypothetical protein